MLLPGLTAFTAIAVDISRHGPLFQADRQLAPFLHDHASPALTLLASAFSGLGDIRFLGPLALIVALYLARCRAWRELLIWAAGLLGCSFLCGTLKSLFAIPRPDRFTFYAFDPIPGYTFPSGHTMGAAIAAGLLVLLWMRLNPRPRAHRLAAAALAALVGISTAASLVYLGVHYLSDVLAALALSLAWLGILRWLLPPARS
jgi:membrane-associated phospholipid phosphatase